MDGCIKVQIVQTSACAACKVASHCNAAESKIKIVDVFTTDTASYQVGQEVTVWASKDVANRALLLGFGAPCPAVGLWRTFLIINMCTDDSPEAYKR